MASSSPAQAHAPVPGAGADVVTAHLNHLVSSLPATIPSLSTATSAWALHAAIQQLHDDIAPLVAARAQHLEAIEHQHKYTAHKQQQFDQRLRSGYRSNDILRYQMERTQMTDTVTDGGSTLVADRGSNELNVWRVQTPIIIPPAVDAQTAAQDEQKQKDVPPQQHEPQAEAEAAKTSNQPAMWWETPTPGFRSTFPFVSTSSGITSSSSSSSSSSFPVPCVVSDVVRERIVSYMRTRGFELAPDTYPVAAQWLTAPSIGWGFIKRDENGNDVNHDITSRLWKALRGNHMDIMEDEYPLQC